jgi:predicted Rossmann fold flavoprotein
MGISVEQVRIKIIGSKLEQTGPVLITHWGMSGPAILKLSAWGARELHAWNWEFGIGVNWIPDFNEPKLKDYLQNHRKEFASGKIGNRNPFRLPQRLWEHIIEISGIGADLRWADLPSKTQNVLMRNLISMEFAVKGKTTFKEEFVTAGGIRLAEVDANTMMSKKLPGLFFAGEILDVDGITGGFNFQHAWTSGYIAGKTIAAS